MNTLEGYTLWFVIGRIRYAYLLLFCSLIRINRFFLPNLFFKLFPNNIKKKIIEEKEIMKEKYS